MLEYECKLCGKKFHPCNSRAKGCSPECRKALKAEYRSRWGQTEWGQAKQKMYEQRFYSQPHVQAKMKAEAAAQEAARQERERLRLQMREQKAAAEAAEKAVRKAAHDTEEAKAARRSAKQAAKLVYAELAAPKRCVVCDAEFKPLAPNQATCGAACRKARLREQDRASFKARYRTNPALRDRKRKESRQKWADPVKREKVLAYEAKPEVRAKKLAIGVKYMRKKAAEAQLAAISRVGEILKEKMDVYRDREQAVCPDRL